MKNTSNNILYTVFILLAMGIGVHAESHIDLLPFQDPKLPVNARVNDLISRMTLDEKISQLGSDASAISRLGVSGYNYWNEALHGVRAEGMTSFPQAIALSSTWDRELVYQVASAISDEARALYIRDGRGLTYWSPVINMSRDPRWGRTEETYGEDPFLTGQIAQNFIRGLQGTDSVYLKTAATVKHFACNNIEVDRHKISSDVDERSLREYYLPAFKECVMKAGVYSVMSAYNALNEVPCPANRTLLTNILRKEWGFPGFVVSDCGAVADVREAHQYVQSAPEAVALCVKSGTDLDCGEYYNSIAMDAVSSGILSENEIDTALARIFRARFLLGEFDPPGLVPYTSIPVSEIDCQEHRDLALLAAKKTIVLLKNQNSILPLNIDSVTSIAVIGPNADSLRLGGYSGSPVVSITPLQGILNRFHGPGKTVRYAPGCSLMTPFDSAAFQNAITLARNSDVVIFVGGTDLFIVSEERDRVSLDLPSIQDSLVQELFLANPKTIVVLVTGFPLSITRMTENIPGIITAWYNGQAQGTAIANVLFGDYNPGGKLTSTWYTSVAELPAMDHYDIKENRTYLYYSGTPLFPFGYGLSYTTFDYSNILVNKLLLNPGDSLMVSATIKNTGQVAGDEVAQFYIHHLLAGIKRPLKELKGFQRIFLQPGESKTVAFNLKHDDLAYYDEKLKAFYTGEGSLEILVGSSSADIRLQAQIQVKGKMVEESFRQNAFSLIEAECFERKSKPVVIAANGKGGQSIGIMAEGDFVVYRNLDFNTGATHFDAYLEVNPEPGQGGVFEIRLDSLDGPLAGLIRLNDLGIEPGYKQISCNVIGADGIRDVFLVFHKSGNGYCKVDWFRFRQVLPVNEGDQYDIQLFPNPASQTFSLRYGSVKPSAMQVEIFSMQGIMKHAFLFEPNMPGIVQVSIDTEDAGLTQGMYIVKCTVGKCSKSFKLCIVR